MAIHGISAFKCVECFLLGFILIMLVHRCECSRDVLTLGESLSINQTIISENGTFALGFFSPNGSTNLYVGIWFAQIPNKSVVWVANREAPLRTISGVLKLSTDGYLSLFDSEGRSLWSTERAQKAKASSVMIMENGNLVMLGQQNKNESVWESFEHPGDTWLTEMKMWKGMRLTSWKSDVDPAPGPFSLGMDPSPGKTQFLLLYNNTKSYWTTGEWVVDRFIYVPELTISGSTLVPSEFVKYSPTSMYFRYLHPDASQRIPQRLVMYKSGDLRSFYGFANGEWNVVWSAPRDMCNVYDMCGAYGVCTSLNIQFCNCLRGFNPKDDRAWYSQEWWASGCVRRTPLNCSTDGFTQLTDKSFPDNVIPSMQTKHATVKECTAACLTNCSCTAFAITNSTPPACQMWFGDLLNVRNSANARPLFIRMAASELSEGGESKAKRTTILALCISLPVAAMAAAVFLLVARLPITPKADVYSYGMTLLEIISGRRNIDLEMQDSSKYYFPTWAANQIHEGNVMNLVDQRISGNADLDEDEVKRAAFVSIVCIQEDESVRPSMGEVVLMLEGKMEPHAPQLSASLQVLVHRHAGAQQTDSSI
ncbi:hypothetical protein SUGI_0752510 [Cryptomeria japonica]|nr:hypothetical protein SUGI_0752510 [Cryptomeria japonica]